MKTIVEPTKPKIIGDVKIIKGIGYTVYEYFQDSQIHGKQFISELVFNARPSQITTDELGFTHIKNTCITKEKLENLTTIEYKTPTH